MGSAPSFDPNVLAHPITTRRYDQLFGQGTNFPQLNRAIASSYPTGSTFKAITATAALQSGAWSLGQIYDDTGSYSDGPGLVRHNAGGAAYGSVDITHAIQFSVDTFFYNLGRLTNRDVPAGRRRCSSGRTPTASASRPGSTSAASRARTGSCPRRAWRDAPQRRWSSPTSASTTQPCCTLVGPAAVVGRRQREHRGRPGRRRGDAAAARRSRTRRSRTAARSCARTSGSEVDSADGSVLQQIDPAPARRVQIAPQNLDAIRTGLHLAASSPGGTSADVFSGWDQGRYPVYGKTGTAQHNGQQDQSWYVCFVPDPVRPILVVVTVEQGGFGAAAAAPAARQILSQWFYGKRGNFVVGQSKTL